MSDQGKLLIFQLTIGPLKLLLDIRWYFMFGVDRICLPVINAHLTSNKHYMGIYSIYFEDITVTSNFSMQKYNK